MCGGGGRGRGEGEREKGRRGMCLCVCMWGCRIIQSTLVISKAKGPSEILRDKRTSTYQTCRTEENTNQTTTFHKWTCNLTPLVKNICWKYCGKWEKSPEEQFHPLSTIFYYLMINFYVKTGIRFSLRDKRLFEITEVEITRVDCKYKKQYILWYQAFNIKWWGGQWRWKDVKK